MTLAYPALRESSPATLILAFDFGMRRIGVAMGDERLGIARPLAMIDAVDNATRFDTIAKLVAEWQPALLVVGLALDMEGGEHEMTQRCRRFAHQLEGRFRLPVALVDERLSSIEAEARLAALGQDWKRRKKEVDAEAAVIILQDYFSMNSNNKQ